MKIYILGDSFTDNLFKNEINKFKNNEKGESPIREYVKLLRNKNLPDPMHFEDYLRMWGHEVINLGKGGCSNYAIYHQFTQIKEPFDRIIINWTGMGRFEWYNDDEGVNTYTGGFPVNSEMTLTDEILVEQTFNREINKTNIKQTKDFISFFVNMFEKYKPIIWGNYCREEIKNNKGFFWDVCSNFYKDLIPEFKKLEIDSETNYKINDKHYGRYGNFYMALVFDTILEHTKDIEHDGHYIKDLELISKIKDRIVNVKHNIIDLKNDII
jgi:hypothetical protein